MSRRSARRRRRPAQDRSDGRKRAKGAMTGAPRSAGDRRGSRPASRGIRRRATAPARRPVLRVTRLGGVPSSAMHPLGGGGGSERRDQQCRPAVAQCDAPSAVPDAVGCGGAAARAGCGIPAQEDAGTPCVDHRPRQCRRKAVRPAAGRTAPAPRACVRQEVRRRRWPQAGCAGHRPQLVRRRRSAKARSRRTRPRRRLTGMRHGSARPHAARALRARAAACPARQSLRKALSDRRRRPARPDARPLEYAVDIGRVFGPADMRAPQDIRAAPSRRMPSSGRTIQRPPVVKRRRRHAGKAAAVLAARLPHQHRLGLVVGVWPVSDAGRCLPPRAASASSR